MPITLDTLPPGSRARVVGFDAGAGLVSSLVQMGLTPTNVLELIRSWSAHVVVRARGVVIALGRGMARKVLVEPLP